MLSEISQTEKDKYCIISLYNKLVNITKRSRLTDLENKLVGTGGRVSDKEIGEREVQATGYKIGSRM